MGDNQVQHGDGPFAGYGTSYDIVRDSGGKLLEVDIKGSTSVKQIKVDDNGGYTLVPVHPALSPVNYMPSSTDLQSGAMNALSGIAIDSKRAILTKMAGDNHASSLFDRVVGDIKVGDHVVLGSVPGLAMATALLPIAILSDMHSDGNSLGEAIFREVPSTLAGSVIGATLGGVATSAAEGAGFGAFAGPVGIVVGGLAGAAAGFLISKNVQDEINAGKAPHADQLLFLPDDPEYLRAYIHDRSSAHPDWNIVDLPPAGVDLNTFNAWKQSILVANQKLTKELHPDLGLHDAYYLNVDPETDARYGVTMANIDGPYIRPNYSGHHISADGPAIPAPSPMQGFLQGIRNSLQPWLRQLGIPAAPLAAHPERRAGGGEIRGPGSSIGDKIPAFLSDGEFVVNASSASANRPLLKAINDDPLYMKKYLQQIESTVATALTKVRAAPGGRDRVDRSMTVHVSTYDVHEAFSKAKRWEQRHGLAEY